MSRRVISWVGIGCAVVLSGCVAQPPAPERSSRVDEPTVPVEIPILAQDSVDRYARDITYRVRNLTCNGLGTGSAFAVDDNLLVTNRHVVEGGSLRLELSTWDGQDLEVDVSASATWADVALLWTTQTLPVVAAIGDDPEPGEFVAAVGYPLGGPWTLTTGSVVDYVPGSVFGEAHPVIRFNAPIAPGNSGGPLLDERGDVAGVVFAVEIGGDALSLAVPISTFEELQDTSSFQTDPVGC